MSNDGIGFYRYLMNTYKDSSEIYIEYDERSSPLHKYLWPEGMLMKFKIEQFNPEKLDHEKFFKEDIRRFEDYCKNGTDYEEFKSMIWFIHNRGLFFKTHGQESLAGMYFEKIEELTLNFYGEDR
jgi:hypothetical protein